jgi:hypothetical protein
VPTLSPAVRFHRQDDPDDCGRACAQMIVGYEGTSPLLQQDTLQNEEADKVIGWFTDPEELRTLINNHVPSSLPVRWVVRAFPAATATNVLNVIRGGIDLGHPAVIAYGDSDHWSVVQGYDLGGSGQVNTLHILDPLAVGAIGSAFVHSGTDPCPSPYDWIVLGPDPATTIGELIVDADPFLNQAVAIAPEAARVDPRSQMRVFFWVRWWERLRPFLRWWRGPLPPPPPLREASLRIVMQSFFQSLLDFAQQMDSAAIDAVVARLQREEAHVRYVRTLNDRRPPFVLVGIPASSGDGVLLVFDRYGSLRRFTVTPTRAMIDSLAAPDRLTAEDLVCIPRYGHLQPFVRRPTPDGRDELVRLYDQRRLSELPEAG